jgi:HPt (histidine-containing phosphotransfer) domain-containing protein
MYEDSNRLTPSAQAPIWDKENALSRLGGDEGILKQIISIYLRETSKGFALLETAIEQKECENVHIYAHALKGSAANVSAYAFIKIAQKMETATRENDMSTMKEDFEDLKVELTKLETELSTYVQA